MPLEPQGSPPAAGDGPPVRAVIVVARDEADRIAATVAALGRAFPGSRVVVADGGSRDRTAAAAAAAGADLLLAGTRGGKGGAATRAVRRVAGEVPPGAVLVLCDGDLGESAALLAPVAEAVESGSCDLAVARFARRVGGGLGLAVGFARWAIRDLSGFEATAPISGQRAARAEVLGALLPFAQGFGMETGMTADAVRAGYRVGEVELDLEHRATGRSARGFAHRARQLADFVRAWATRRVRGRRRAPRRSGTWSAPRGKFPPRR